MADARMSRSLRVRRLDGAGSLGRLPLAPPSPRGGGQASSLRDSARSSALRIDARYGSSHFALRDTPAPAKCPAEAKGDE